MKYIGEWWYNIHDKQHGYSVWKFLRSFFHELVRATKQSIKCGFFPVVLSLTSISVATFLFGRQESKKKVAVEVSYNQKKKNPTCGFSSCFFSEKAIHLFGRFWMNGDSALCGERGRDLLLFSKSSAKTFTHRCRNVCANIVPLNFAFGI